MGLPRKRSILYVAIGLTMLPACLVVHILSTDQSKVRDKCGSWPEPIARARRSGWHKLQKGMTKEQVIALLGDSEAKSVPKNFEGVVVGEGEKVFRLISYETWEYDWSHSPGNHVGAQGHVAVAYHVQFDKDGKLADWSEPDPKLSWLSWILKRNSK